MKRTIFAFASAAILVLSSGIAAAQYRPGPPPPPPPGEGQWHYEGGRPGTWTPDWDRRPFPRRGVCFFTDAHFSGHRFCVRSGERLPSLPEGYGHSISSIQSFGGAFVVAYSRPGFQGQQARFDTAEDLGYTSRGGRRGWNDRISSLIVQ
jgi:hypothetical protein